jgi:2-polyprenyl-6-methoxyphenol hydroxylase-like FAD-dependent oxidoreductase
MPSAPIVIVGGGPVGMVLAMNLAVFGVRSVLVNIEPSSRWHPKGNTHNARTMEHYRRLGIAGAIRKVGLPSDHPTDVGYFTTLNGWELARHRMPSEQQKMAARDAAASTDQIPEPLFRANQMYVEAELFRHIQTLKPIAPRYGWRCVDIAETAGGGFAVTIEEVASGRVERLDCDYLVGCDGGRSFVRRWLGISYSGERPRDQLYGSGATVATHMRAPDLYQRGILHRRCWQYWTVNSSVRTNLVTLDGAGEFLFSTRIRSVDEPPDADYIASRFRQTVGEDVPFEFIGHWPWTAGNALVADSFGRGRAWLAGDAVHLFTPTGGFGMNTGIDDAANLGWKLAAMVQGWGGPGLLESYALERRAIAFRNTGMAKRFSLKLADVPAPPEITENTAAGAAARAEAGAILSTLGEEFASVGIQLGARYDGSPIIAPDGTAPPPDDHISYTPNACPGGRAPHMFLPDRSSLFDHFGPGFTLLRLRSGHDARPIAAVAEARRIPFAVYDVPAPDAREFYGADLALIRPDQHVAWRGDRLPEDAGALLARVTGHPS